MLCPSCGHENREGRKFCVECGAKLEFTCFSCGAACVPEEKFCGYCGAPLEMSTKVAGKGFRFQSEKHFFSGSDFCKTFEDGPWKWSAQERFAPADLMCGHFLALTEEGAASEAAAYGIKTKHRFLLGIEFEIDKLLDLTSEDVLVEAWRATLAEERHRSKLLTLRATVHEDAGGNLVTDEIALWAVRQGFKGVLFFSARSIPRPLSLTNDRQAGLYVAGEIFEDLRRDPTTQNVVVFSGRYLVPGISKYWRQGRPARNNPFYRCTPEELDRVLEVDSEEWNENINELIRLAGEQRFTIAWDGKVEEVQQPPPATDST